MQPSSIAFFDDHPLLLEGLKSLFEERDDFTVVGTGTGADAAVEIARTLYPKLIVIDLSMPGNAFGAIETIRKISPSSRIVIFTASASIEHAVRALKAGASAYVLKGSTHSELLQAMAAVLLGETYITPSFASKVISALSSAREAHSTGRVNLSVREEQIVKLLLGGHTNREIGQRLSISEKTVKQYMTQLMQKLEVRNRLEVVLAAQQLRTLQGNPSRDLPN